MAMHIALRFKAAVAVLAASGSALAHDFWIEPSTYRPAGGELVHVGLRVGDLPQFEPVPRTSERIEKFIVVGPGGEQPVAGEDGTDPAGSFRPDQPGLYVVAYRSKLSRIELEAEKFEAYLREEGLDSIIDERAARGQSAQPGREIYSRCAKSLVIAGDATAAPADRALGLRLELVARHLPQGVEPASEMQVQLLLEGKPCAEVLVKARGPDRAATPISARCDKDGRATLPVASAGPWIITAVHMIVGPEGSNADWESLWASLTFEIPATGTEAPSRP